MIDLPFGLTQFASVRENINKVLIFGGLSPTGPTDTIYELTLDSEQNIPIIQFKTITKSLLLLIQMELAFGRMLITN